MQDIDKYRIPQHLDAPERFLFWTKDEAFLILGCFLGGLWFGMFIEGLVGGFVLWFAYRRIKRGMSKRRLLAAIYWIFPHWLTRHFPCYKGWPPSHIRFWIG